MKIINRTGGRALLSATARRKAARTYTPKSPIFIQGEASDAVFYVETGKVKLTVLSRRGKEALIAILGAGDFLGEECLAGTAQRITTATTLSECTIARIEKVAAVDSLRADPAFSGLFLAYLLARSVRTLQDLAGQRLYSSEKRLARVLLSLADDGTGQQAELVIGRISQETLAEMVGTTRSRVSYFMNKFRKLGFIKYNGTLEVHSSLVSVVLHD